MAGGVIRKVRIEVGIDIVCRDHPTEVLFRPRLNVDTCKFREADPHGHRRGHQSDSGRLKYSRRCPQPVRFDDGTVARWPDGSVRRCEIAPEFKVDRVKVVLLGLREVYFRRVHVLTDQEMETLIRYPQRIAGWLAARARSAGP
jgi:hypothetical protein